MVKEFGNNTDDSSEGGFGQYEGADPSNAPGRDAEDDSMTMMMRRRIPRRILRNRQIGLKPKRRV